MIHVFSMNGYNFAVDGNSGSIHVLDDISYQILNEVQMPILLEGVLDRLSTKYSKEELTEAYKEIQSLQEQGLLFTDHENIEEVLVKQNTNHVNALCLHVAHDCNLRCQYCFASKGDYKSGRSLMSKEVALKSVDYLVHHSGKRHNIEIDFFGGEPLMNFDVVREVVAYGKQIEKETGKHFYFTITTNGALLDDERIAFINQYMDNIVISLDGRKEVHDAIRCDRAGKGTYDKILPLTQKLIEERGNKSYFIRGTFTAKNKDFSKDVMHLADLGFKEISIEPVVGVGEEIYFMEQDMPSILEEYEKLAIAYLNRLREGKYFRFYHFNLNLYGGPCIYKRITACGAGFEYLAVSPEGHIYPCHQFVGQEDFMIGDIDHGIQNKEMSDKFRKNTIMTKEKCIDCWAKLFCSGGCHANAWYSNADIAVPNEMACIMQKKRIECAIMIQAAMQEEN